jgi:hypothetical protein
VLRPSTLRSSLFGLFVGVAAIGCDHATPETAKPAPDTAKATTASSKGPTLELFVMSQCPYGVEAENGVIAARKLLGGALDVKLAFIGDGQPGALSSMHGPDEVKGDLAQICAQKQDPAKLLDLVACMNEDPRSVAEGWRACATRVGMDAAALAACTEGDEGQRLLAASFAEASKRGATGSPTMFLAGKPYEGGRKGPDLARAVCEAAGDGKPSACSSLPAPPVVRAIFLSDERCKACDIRALEPRLKGELGGLVVEHVDYGTDKGKALYAELHAAAPSLRLPAALLGPEVEKDEDGYATLKRFLSPAGKYRALAIGGEWDPTAEICDNGADDDDDGRADCADDGCKADKLCRPVKPKTLDLFVMSQCPYGAKAMIATSQFMDTLGKDVSLDVHYIGGEEGGELRSLHGAPEVEEDLRQRCAIERYRTKNQFLKYLACRSEDYRSAEWEPCAKKAGMVPAVIQSCVEKEGKDLLRKDFALADSLHVTGSPTFLVNNRRDFNAIEASEIQREYCADNPGLDGCKNALPAAPAPAGEAPTPACDGPG